MIVIPIRPHRHYNYTIVTPIARGDIRAALNWDDSDSTVAFGIVDPAPKSILAD